MLLSLLGPNAPINVPAATAAATTATATAALLPTPTPTPTATGAAANLHLPLLQAALPVERQAELPHPLPPRARVPHDEHAAHSRAITAVCRRGLWRVFGPLNVPGRAVFAQPTGSRRAPAATATATTTAAATAAATAATATAAAAAAAAAATSTSGGTAGG
jgi:hypothetical protein